MPAIAFAILATRYLLGVVPRSSWHRKVNKYGRKPTIALHVNEDAKLREALTAHWLASAAGAANTEHDMLRTPSVNCPQSGERILGQRNLQALRSHHPVKPSGESSEMRPVDTITHQEQNAFATAKSSTRLSITRTRSRPRPGGANGCSGSPDVSASSLPRCLDLGDVDLLHGHHCFEDAFSFVATSRKRLGQSARGDLP